MRIAFISTVLHYPWGGADTLWTHAAEAAAGRGDSLFISVAPSTAAHARIVALRQRGAVIFERHPPAESPGLVARVSGKIQRLLGPREPLAAALAAFQPDLVVISQGGTYDLLGLRELVTWLLEARTRFRLIANWQSEHPSLGSDDLAFMRTVLTAAGRVNFVSTRNLTTTRRHLLAPLPSAGVLQNPLRWQPADIPPWPETPGTRLATVSRLEHNKGVHLLLHALAATAADLPDWELDVFGVGPQEAYLRETANHLSLGPRVRFRGHVGNLRAIWAENHLLVSPAIDDGVPMTIPEAMLCTRPVLATCVGGAEDWLRHGETGFLCAAPTLPLLAAALRDAALSRERWQTMGAAAAVAAQARYRADDHLALIA
jgi:glycosyltransferase involved in cell wall biosynthesis